MTRHHHRFNHSIMLCVLLGTLGLWLVSCAAPFTDGSLHIYTHFSNQNTTPTPGQQLLDRISQRLNAAKTLHGNFTLTLKGRALSGTIKIQQWSAIPGKSRNEVVSSTLPQVVAGSLTVSDGRKLWQYDPAQKVVYAGPTQSTNSVLTIPGRGQVQLLLNTLLSVFGNSSGTLINDSANSNGKAAYQVHVVPLDSDNQPGTTNGLDYQGEVYIDKASEQPLRMDLNLSGIGPVSLSFDTLDLNTPIDTSKFTFVAPAGVKEEPLPNTTTTGNGDTITLGQAQKQSSYHLLSISGDHSEYSLNGVTTLGTPKNRIYSLNYMKGNLQFTISEGEALANLTGAPGQNVSLRNTSAIFAQTNGTSSLSWTEKGIGIRITGALSLDQATGIAQLLV